MSVYRQCCRSGCREAAVATLTYQYQESTVVLGPLSSSAEPSAYDLCVNHAESFTAPKGWQVIRLQDRFEPAPPSDDDLLALADAVRQASRKPVQAERKPPEGSPRKANIPPARPKLRLIKGNEEE